jgi:hypothetical protein
MRLLLLICTLALTGCAGGPVRNPNMVYRGPAYVWPEANQLDLNNLPITN